MIKTVLVSKINRPAMTTITNGTQRTQRMTATTRTPLVTTLRRLEVARGTTQAQEKTHIRPLAYILYHHPHRLLQSSLLMYSLGYWSSHIFKLSSCEPFVTPRAFDVSPTANPHPQCPRAPDYSHKRRDWRDQHGYNRQLHGPDSSNTHWRNWRELSQSDDGCGVCPNDHTPGRCSPRSAGTSKRCLLFGPADFDPLPSHTQAGPTSTA